MEATRNGQVEGRGDAPRAAACSRASHQHPQPRPRLVAVVRCDQAMLVEEEERYAMSGMKPRGAAQRGRPARQDGPTSAGSQPCDANGNGRGDA